MDCLRLQDTHQEVKIQNIPVKYNKVGGGEVIVLLPPPLLDYKIYCEFQKILCQNYNTISLDLPVVGDINHVISILVDIIKIGTVQQFHLIASSATGWIAQYIAAKLKNQIKSLILINSFHSNQNYGKTYKIGLKSTKLLPSGKFKKEIIKHSEFLRSNLPKQQLIDEYFVKRVNELNKNGVRQQMSWFVNHKNPPPVLDIPILLFSPFKDPIIKSIEYINLVEYHTNVAHVKVNSKAHLLFISNKNEIIKKIVEFISDV